MTVSSGTMETPRTPFGFCAVMAVITVVPQMPRAVKVFRSAWTPAPPPESEPAIVQALGSGAIGSVKGYSTARGLIFLVPVNWQLRSGPGKRGVRISTEPKREHAPSDGIGRSDQSREGQSAPGRCLDGSPGGSAVQISPAEQDSQPNQRRTILCKSMFDAHCPLRRNS